MEAVAATYLRVDEASVTAEPWTDDGGAQVGERVEHWDPVTNLQLVRTVTLDLDAIRAQCLLGADASFALLASWYSNRTRLSGHGMPVEFGGLSGLVRTIVGLSVPGAQAGGRVELRTRVLLRSAGANPSPISPRRPAAILWSDVERVLLEGSAGRFPIAAVDFAAVARVPDDAAWFIDWDPHDLSHPVMGSVRLLVNRSNQRVASAVRSGTPDPGAPMLRSIIRVDVARQLIRSGLANDEFVSLPDGFAEDTVGRMIRDLITTVWPGVPITAVRERALADPARFEAEIQAALEISA